MNISHIYIPHKSETCFSMIGNQLSVYGSFSEAQESANYQFSQTGIQLPVYQCGICGKYHLKQCLCPLLCVSLLYSID